MIEMFLVFRQADHSEKADVLFDEGIFKKSEKNNLI
jgi:hypothetical protein